MTLDVRLRGYLPNGASVGLLPAPGDWDLAAPLNDVPALKLDYSTAAARSELMGQPLELAAEVSVDNGATWVEPPGCRFLYLRDGRDPLKAADSWQVEAPGYLWLLKKAKVAVNPGDPNPGKRTWLTAVTPGRVLGLFVNEAKARGALAGVTRTWTDTHDSAGVAWPETLLRTYDAGIDLLAVALDLVDAGYVDIQTTGRDLQLYVPERGTDRTIGNSQVTLTALSSPSAPFRRTWEGIAGAIMGNGDAGLMLEYVNPGAVQPWGRWEDFVTHAGVSDEGTLQALMEHQGELTEGPRLEFTQEFEPTTGPRPFVDFGVGDYIWNRDLAGARNRYRVRQITLQSKGARIAGNVVLNDRFLEGDVRTQRQLQALTGGASVSGSSGGLPGADILPPEAPTAPVVTSDFYLDGGGGANAQVTVNWADVTTNMDGTPLTDLDRYQVWSKPDGSAAWAMAGEVPGGTSVAFLSPYPPGTIWDFRVRAVDTSGNLSDYSPTTSVLTATDAEPPEEPSVPVVASEAGLIQVNWDGENAAGNPQDEPDLFRVEVHILTTSGAVPTPGSSLTMVSSFTGPGVVAVPGYAVGTTYYVRLVAVDASLNASPPSDPAAVTVVSGASDGNVPNAAGWTITLAPLGLMALTVNWTALANPDALLYRVYASSTTPVVKDAAHLVGVTGGTSHTFGAINGVLLDAGADYYVTVVPEDADGPAATSPTAGPVRIRQAGEGSVDDGWTYLGDVSASQLTTGDLMANLAIIGSLATAGSGRRISLSSADGFRAQNANGDTVAQIPTDESQDISFQMDLVAKSITALGSVAMRATDNEIAQAAALVLRSATAAPVTPPTATIEWETLVRGDGSGFGASWKTGGNFNSGKYYTASSIFGASSVVEIDPTTGTDGWVLQVGDGNAAPANIYGCYRDGASVYVLALVPRPFPTGAQWQVRKYTYATKAFVSQWILGDEPDAFTSLFPNGAPTICRASDGNMVLIYSDATAGNKVRRTVCGPDGGNTVSSNLSTQTFVGPITWAYEGTADTGVTRLWWGSTADPSQAFAHTATGSSFAQDTTLGFPLADDSAFVTYDTTLGRFVSLSRVDGNLRRYQGGGNTWSGTNTQTWWVTNTWRDNDAGGTGLHETVQGPATTVAMKKRARLRVTTPPIPTDANNLNLDDPNAVSIYVGKVDGARGNQWRQAAPATGVRTAVVSAAVFSNADTQHPNPPSVGNFPNLTPARIYSDAADGNGALTSLNGDGTARINGMTMEDTGWTNMVLVNGWTNLGGAWQVARYCRRNGIVYIEGTVVPGTNAHATGCFVLPAGFRPSGDLLLQGNSNTTSLAAGRFDITSGGVIRPQAAVTWLGITFSFKAAG